MRHSKKLAALAIAAGVAITATAAFAYWSTDGSGSGEASALGGYTNGSSKVTVVQDEIELASLVPGGPAQALGGKFTNTNPGGVWVDHIHASVVDTSDPGCTAADFEFGTLTVTDHEVAKGGALDGAWTGSISMVDRPGENQDGCKDATVNISYEAFGAAHAAGE